MNKSASGQSPPSSQVACGLALLYGVLLLPILLADRPYNDDLKRALFGRTGWDSNGRPLTTLLMKLLQCYDRALVDISPFTQLAAVAVLVFLGTMIAKRYCRSSAAAAALMTFPLGAQPFFLENLSFKFDSLSMAIALLCALAPFAWPGEGRRRWWLGVLAIFACLNFYQPALHAFMVFLLLDIALAAVARADAGAIWRRSRFLVGQLAAGAAIYQVVVGIHIGGWVKQKSVPIRSFDELGLVGVNLQRYAGFVADAFNGQWWAYFGPLVALLGLVVAVVCVRYALGVRRSHPAWAVAPLVAGGALMPLWGSLAVLGSFVLLADPPVQPRMLVAVGPLLCAGLLVFDAARREWRRSPRWTLAAGGMLAAGCCIFASAYGNASAAQQRYEQHVALQLADDLAQARSERTIVGVLLHGSAGYAPLAAHVVEQMPLVGSLVPPYLDAADLFRTHIFLVAYMPEFVDLRLVDEPGIEERRKVLLDAACLEAPRHVRNAYRLHVAGDVAVVFFGSSYASRCGHDDGGGPDR